jgi:hypothetical protein
VQVAPVAPPGDAPLVIAWPSGLHLEVPPGSCPTWIGAIVAHLRPSC